MHAECSGCGNRGAGLAAVGARCRFCGGTYEVVGIPPFPACSAAGAHGVIDAMRRARRDAHEPFEQYRRSVFRSHHPGIMATTESLGHFWQGRSDSEYDRLATRHIMATAILNSALVSLGLPTET